jgi:hypothetical protein
MTCGLTAQFTSHDTQSRMNECMDCFIIRYAEASLLCQSDIIKKSLDFPEGYHCINTELILWSEEQGGVSELTVRFTEMVDISLR